MKNHQCPIQAMFGNLVVGVREIVTMHDLEEEVVEDIAALLADLFTTYVECGRNHHQCSSLAMFRELAMGIREIQKGDRDEEPPSGRELLDDLLAMHLERCPKKQKPPRRGLHPAMAELLARLDRLGTDHDDAEDAASTAVN